MSGTVVDRVDVCGNCRASFYLRSFSLVHFPDFFDCHNPGVAKLLPCRSRCHVCECLLGGSHLHLKLIHGAIIIPVSIINLRIIFVSLTSGVWGLKFANPCIINHAMPEEMVLRK